MVNAAERGEAETGRLISRPPRRVACADGNCTISDGTVSEVCEDCCVDGGCNPK